MIVKVTQDNIDRGARGDATECPVALALQDLGLQTPWAGSTSLGFVVGNDVSWSSALPEVARHFINEFDRAQPVEPFEFSIEYNLKKEKNMSQYVVVHIGNEELIAYEYGLTAAESTALTSAEQADADSGDIVIAEVIKSVNKSGFVVEDV